MFDSFFSTPTCNDISSNYSPNICYGSLAVDRPYNTNFLGGTSMCRPLAHDVYSGVKMEQRKNYNGLVSTLKFMGLFVVGSVVLSKFSKLGKAFSELGKKK